MKNQIITPEMKKSLEDKFLGKRVMVKTKHGKIGGICNFIGNNEYVPSFGLQINCGSYADNKCRNLKISV